MKKKKRKDLPKVKKEIRDFLLSEEGKITKKDIAKLGLSFATIAMMFGSSEMPAAAQTHTSSPTTHTNTFVDAGHISSVHASHSSHSSHASHGSHGSHGQW